MKRCAQSAKLVVRRETLRVLGAVELTRAAGGIQPPPDSHGKLCPLLAGLPAPPATGK